MVAKKYPVQLPDYYSGVCEAPKTTIQDDDTDGLNESLSVNLRIWEGELFFIRPWLRLIPYFVILGFLADSRRGTNMARGI